MAVKLNYQKAKALGYTDEQIQKYLAQRPQVQMSGGSNGINMSGSEPIKKGKKDRGMLDLLSVGTSIGGGILGAPLGPAGVIGGSALGGGVGQLLEQLINKEDIDTGDIGSEALWSGAGGALGLGVGKVLGGAAKTATSSRLLKTLPKGTKVDKIDDLTEFALRKGAPSGSYMDKARGYSKAAKELGESRRALVGKKSVITKDALFKRASQEVDTDEIKDLQVLVNRLGTKPPTESRLLEFKEGLNQLAQRESKKGHSARALQGIIDDVLGGNAGYGDLTTDLGKSIALKGAYTESAKQGTKIPYGFGSIPTGPMGGVLQKAGDMGVRAANRVGQSPTLAQILGQGTTAPFRSSGTTEPVDPTPTMDDTMINPPTKAPKKNNMKEILKVMALQDLANGGKNITEIAALLKMFDEPVDDKTKKVESLTQSVDLLFQNYQSAGGGQGAGGLLESFLGKTPGVRSLGLAPDAQVYEDQRKALIAPLARAISGEVGVLTDKDIARAEGLLPRLSDPSDVAQKKILNLKLLIQQAGSAGTPDAGILNAEIGL